MFRRYVTLNGIMISAAFSVAAAWIILSATRHSNAQAKCIKDFFTPASSSSTGGTLCNIFPWVDIGIMAALWVLLAILQVSRFYPTIFPYLSDPQLYLFVVLSSYGTAQRRDHAQYDPIHDPSQPLTTENIPLDTHADPWDSRPSVDHQNQYGARDPYYKHIRNQSSVSASDIMNAPYQKPKDGLSNSNYDYSYGYTDNHPVTRP